MTTRSIPSIILLLSLSACGPDVSLEGWGETGLADMTPGEAWAPCPTHAPTGLPTLCNDEMLACMPATSDLTWHPTPCWDPDSETACVVDANICLPLDGCDGDQISDTMEIGWSGACFPRCADDSDCAEGLSCVMALSDNSRMCAWPL